MKNLNLKNILSININNNIISSYGICNINDCILSNTKKKISNKLKSVIVMLFPYYNDYEIGNLSKFSRSYDYHKIILKILSNICQILKKLYINNIFIPYVDNTFINEVKAAYISGTGYLGNNGLILDEKYGPFVYIGEIVTDLILEYTNKKKHCYKCNNCLKKCPVLLKKEKCISKITQTKNELTDFEKNLIINSGYIWGCDICINACYEANKFKINHNIFSRNLIRNITFNDINLLSNKQFKEIYYNRSFIWKGKEILKRNLLLQL